MPRRRLPLRKINEVLRLTAQGMSQRQASQSVGLATSTVSDYVERARRAGLSWPLPEGLDGGQLEARLFPAPVVPGNDDRRCSLAGVATLISNLMAGLGSDGAQSQHGSRSDGPPDLTFPLRSGNDS